MMRRALSMLVLVSFAALCSAEDEAQAPRLPAAGTPAAPITRVDPPPDPKADATAGGVQDRVRFTTDAKWEIAGYNNEEIVFTIFIKNEDARIIRCTTRIKGSYFENGQKLGIEDRQLTTIFPDQQTQVGNWLGMDEQSGATYSVTCRPV